MDIKSGHDVKVGDTVKYYDYSVHKDRVGKVCDKPSTVSHIASNYIWCNFDDENVPEAIDISKTTLMSISSLVDDDGKDDPDPPEMSIQMTCPHPKESVVTSFVMVLNKKVDFKLCKKCGADWDI